MLHNDLKDWKPGPPPVRDDGGLAIVELAKGVQVDGQPHFSQPVIVARWNSKLRATAGGHRLSYENVLRHIDLAPAPTVEDLLGDPSASSWLKTCLIEAMSRDPVDAAADAEVLAHVLKDRAESCLRASGHAVRHESEGNR